MYLIVDSTNDQIVLTGPVIQTINNGRAPMRICPLTLKEANEQLDKLGDSERYVAMRLELL